MINSNLAAVFKKYFDDDSLLGEIARRNFVYSNCLMNKSGLFIGINPSYRKGDYKDSYIFNVFDEVIRNDSYFSKFHDLAERLDIKDDWNYLDLLKLRETNQKIIDAILKKSRGVDFVFEQLLIARNEIEKLKPKYILVTNQKARKFFGVDAQSNNNIWMGYKFHFDETIGTYVISGVHNSLDNSEMSSTALIGTPVFFSGFLKYLSSSDYERLVWQVRRFLHSRGLLE